MAGDSRSGSWNKVEGAAQEASQRLASRLGRGPISPANFQLHLQRIILLIRRAISIFRLLDASPTLGMGSLLRPLLSLFSGCA
jgi:hypothetical protein